MKSKTSLTLMELAIMLMVFALAAALCLQAFAGADHSSKHSAALDRAVAKAQNAAETLKGCRGNYEAAAALYGGTWDGSRWTIDYGDSTLCATPQISPHDLLEQAEITVTEEDGTILYTLSIAWQKEGSRP